MSRAEQSRADKNNEYLDVLDSNGVKTGEIKMRGEVHANSLWHRLIVVVVVDDDKNILMQKRSKDKEKYPGMWDISVAGHVTSGNNSMDAAATEVNEEIGMSIPFHVEARHFRYITSFRSAERVSATRVDKHFWDFFVLRVPKIDLSKMELQIEEVEKVDMLSFSAIRKLIKENKVVMPGRKPIYDELEKYINRIT